MSAIILLVLLGAALVFLETVLVGGVWAIAGILCCAWAVWMALAEYGIWAASIVGAVSIALCIAAFLVWLYVIPKTPFGKKFYLNSKQDGKAPSADFSRLVGCKGVAATVLVPSGKVQIGENFYDANSVDLHIEQGTEVIVVGADVFGIKVKKFKNKNRKTHMPIGTIITVILGIVALVAFVVIISFINTWLKALLAGAPVSMLTLIAMRLRGVPYGMIVDSRIMAVKAGLDLTINQLEEHYLAEGHLIPTIQALIASDKAGMDLSWKQACAIDLATKGTGKTVGEAVRTSINPKVIDCPNPSSGRKSIDGVAKDGIQVKVRARVTVRTNLERFVGGAQEETIIARVGEGIVTTIGSADSYKFVLEHPDRISKVVLERGLDSGTAYEILSIDIADVDVGENVGAKLQEAQAMANKNMAQAQAEIRRAAAVALEQEMKAKVEDMKAKVVEAEAQVPLALAESLRSGKMGFMDYYRLKNIQADTSMRESISGEKPKDK